MTSQNDGAKAISEPKIPSSALPLDGKEKAPELPPHPTQTAEDHYKSCPTCHQHINEMAKKELEPEILKGYREKVKSIKEPVVCKGCGEIVERSEPKCSNCGSSEARKL